MNADDGETIACVLTDNTADDASQASAGTRVSRRVIKAESRRTFDKLHRRADLNVPKMQRSSGSSRIQDTHRCTKYRDRLKHKS
ncbi:hypothetical protein ACFQS7_25855 [Dankookia sp. GCM10030260]|uniref:hypothetical protein n=1 Tax=Dankookia sp. GCM10030260 TaxID=3273390 RepID=UPI00360B0F6E